MLGKIPTCTVLQQGETTGGIRISGGIEAPPDDKSTGSVLLFIKYRQFKKYVHGNWPCSPSPGSIQDGLRRAPAQVSFGHSFHTFFLLELEGSIKHTSLWLDLDLQGSMRLCTHRTWLQDCPGTHWTCPWLTPSCCTASIFPLITHIWRLPGSTEAGINFMFPFPLSCNLGAITAAITQH